MVGNTKIFLRVFARVSPVFVSAGFALLLCSLFSVYARGTAAKATSAVKREAASNQYAKAQEQRAELDSKPADKRTLAEYKQVVSTFRRVTLITPRAPEVPDSLLAVGELYTEMGDHFGRSYYQSAVDTYEFLAREYPTSRYCQDVLLRVAKLQRDQLGETADASKTLEAFLKRYPHSPRKREAQESLAELALLQSGEKAAVNDASSTKQPSAIATEISRESAKSPGHTKANAAERAESNGIPRVKHVRASSTGNAARVTIDLDGKVQYTSGRIANPDRIFFDLHAARLTPDVARAEVQVGGNLLTAVRVGQNHAGVVRVVLDVNGVKDYAASLLTSPSRLVIDLYASGTAAAPLQTAQTKFPETKSEGADSAQSRDVSPLENSGEQPVAAKNTGMNTNDSGSASSINSTSMAAEGIKTPSAAVTAPAVIRNTLPLSKSAQSKSLKARNASTKPDLIRSPSTALPKHDGQSSLTRALGLKIGRIVIDAGHGGHDTGTIGPTGLMEKDLCLDVALRLGKIIQQRLPSAEVVYTRSDDTYIPLEERTNLANQAKADLFISIHANSSQDHAARGIETYYLNLKGSPEAMEVAARENSVSQEGVHDLQDLVKKIARSEKIDESREFAEDIQDSLAKRIQKSAKTVKNRGVRKAPFVVLIGADMPSVLTEISFLSNPADEQLLKKPEQRQRVAEGLYQGVASYLESMNSVTLNLPARPGSSRASAALVEQSRNQQ